MEEIEALTSCRRNHHSRIMSAIEAFTQAHERMNINANFKLGQLRSDVLNTLKDLEGEAEVKNTSIRDLSEQLLALAQEGKKVGQEQQVLQGLIFEEMRRRQEIIKIAHKTTLDWVFQRHKTNFLEWLEVGKNIFWVRGKVSELD